MSRNRGGRGEAGGHRHVRLQQLMEEEISALLRDEVVDPRLDGVMVTRVELSVDYRSARVGFVLPRDRGPVDRERALRALSGASAFLRARLSEAMGVKSVPELRFTWDRDAAASPEDP
jgi:ribosome-binding factor A